MEISDHNREIMKDSENLLIIFARNPEVGKVKSRLAHTLGDEFACEIYRDLMMKIRDQAESLTVNRAVFLVEETDGQSYWPPDKFMKKLQTGDTIGDRMLNAFAWAFDKSFHKVVLIGTDIYSLGSDIVRQAFDDLSKHEVVLGPTYDGGYYLIGLNTMNNIFENISWSTESVFDQTMSFCRKKKLSVKVLQKLVDIDRAEDLKLLPEYDQNYYKLMMDAVKSQKLFEL